MVKNLPNSPFFVLHGALSWLNLCQYNGFGPILNQASGNRRITFTACIPGFGS